MALNILTVPGYHGSGEGHWQTWLERAFPAATRVTRIDWERPVLHTWAKEILRTVDEAPEPSVIVAHSFGCLASALAIAKRPGRVAGAILVAPADPQRFTLLGPNDLAHEGGAGIQGFLPHAGLNIPGYLIGSENDPWFELEQARELAGRWQLEFINAGAAGHINVASGHGRWPWIHGFAHTFHQRLSLFHATSSRDLRSRAAG